LSTEMDEIVMKKAASFQKLLTSIFIIAD